MSREFDNGERPLPIGSRLVVPIGVDLFFSEEGIQNNLPAHISNNPTLLEQARQRRELFQAFDRVLEKIPDPTEEITDALREGKIGPGEVASLWNKICDLLSLDENNRRLLLYLPFEILPDLNMPERLPAEVSIASQRFGSVYKEAWIKLLFENEPRANFIDGDILEPTLGEPERISKAGHLVPEILARGIIEMDDLLLLLNSNSPDWTLRSLSQGALVAYDRGLIAETDWEKIRLLMDQKIGGLSSLAESWDQILPGAKITMERERWLKKVEEEEALHFKALQLAIKIDQGEPILTVFQGEEALVKVLALIQAGKYFSKSRRAELDSLIIKSLNIFQEVWAMGDSKVKEAIVNGLSHWVRLGIVDEAVLQSFGIQLKDLSSPSQYSQEQIVSEFSELVEAARRIKDHPILSQALYPVFLLFGSRIKGYAETNSDFDAAVFFRPEVRREERENILEILRRDIPQVGSLGRISEYWAKQEREKLGFEEPPWNSRVMLGESQIHFFFGGVWIGYGNEFMKIYSDMLERYLDLSRFGDQKEDVRVRLLGQVELDVLQYRLMHKGYRKLYPTIEREDTFNSDLIDWKSDFWDPGYRRVATKLFLSRVFLPDLS